MAGYGNRTAPDYTTTTTPAHLGAQHAQTRLGAPSTSAPTYGAGYGNKRASLAPTTSAEDYDKASDHAAAESDDERGGGETPLRFDSQTTHGSAPYSGAHTYGSASTAGAGWGNKTGSFSGGGEREGM
ncbi:uncharacterized protein EKO05_0011357 [Ascochyta rabiei]|uniref:Uncharacterized protein n=1 Tax=Didymella rabiei TaxID=5454 RepID=A0A163C7J7_DIDRA|nr:uncharacterized protein EKO05_0011357 [Ascochyta rabiei]KZM22258.1 hypothetical protein ST47_g6590 [Ascochyta rabiei]UPX21159.1 hypothetical protein EKO05_0011357 [Ascochyta rabiei]